MYFQINYFDFPQYEVFMGTQLVLFSLHGSREYIWLTVSCLG